MRRLLTIVVAIRRRFIAVAAILTCISLACGSKKADIKYVAKWKGNDYSHNIAISPNGNIYAGARETEDADGYTYVQYFTPTGTPLGKWGKEGDGNGEFMDIGGIAIAPDGKIYVSDNYEPRVQYFTANGSYLGKWGGYGSKYDNDLSDGQFMWPGDIAISPNRTIYVCDSGNDRVQYFNSEGSFLGKWGIEAPLYITTGPDGSVWVNSRQRRVFHYTSTGSLIGELNLADRENHKPEVPAGIAITDRGNILLAERTRDTIWAASPDGSFIDKWELRELARHKLSRGERIYGNPFDVEVGPDNNVYVAMDRSILQLKITEK